MSSHSNAAKEVYRYFDKLTQNKLAGLMFYVYQLYITELELEIGATEPSWHRPPPLESFGTSRELY